MTTTTPLHTIAALGQSIWYDNIQRGLLQSGEFARMVQSDGIRGVTSNPTIFEKAITGSKDYDQALAAVFQRNPRGASRDAFMELAIEDIQSAADILRGVYDASDGCDGFVSMEVSPDLAHDTSGTVDEAQRLFARIDRPNVMIKVPATRAGVAAVEQLIDAGVNVNATLLFSVQRYIEIADAYLMGLESRLRRGQSLSHIASVASFFVSRVDTAVDRLLDERISKLPEPERPSLRVLQGSIAVANAKHAYREFRQLFDSERFEPLRAAGAQLQRLLWASTGTKNPNYSNLLYVDSLIGPDTVNTIPPATLQALKRHTGTLAPTLTQGVDEALDRLRRLPSLDIDLDAVTHTLEDEGVAAFATSYHSLLQAIDAKTADVSPHLRAGS